MPRLLFPFRYGSVPAVVPPIPPPPPRWTNLAGAATNWITDNVSTVRQFHRVHPQTAIVFGQSVNFEFRAQTDFAHKVKSNGDEIHVTSTITTP
jgi:hypothetical protein